MPRHKCGKEEVEKILSEIGPQEPRGVSAEYIQTYQYFFA
jgi:hypothetical protein